MNVCMYNRFQLHGTSVKRNDRFENNCTKPELTFKF